MMETMNASPALRRWAWPLLAVLLVVGCSRPGTGPPDAAAGAVVVASFNFQESRMLAEIYALALEDAGITVRRELDLGTREMVVPALRQGLVDVVPEYLGSAVAAMAPASPPGGDDDSSTTVEVARARLATALEAWGVIVLEPAAAQNQNGVVVALETAERHELRTVSDLAGLARPVVLGGPPECPRRPYCLPGLEQRYGLTVERFVPVEGPERTGRALADGVVDAAVMFTTDGRLAERDLVLLDDDLGLHPAENVVPVVRAEVAGHEPDLVTVLDGVSARLSTPSLRFLNWRVAVAGRDVVDEARAWLLREGLIAR
jgi:osmoprotectant transport system substrate-binding protein